MQVSIHTIHISSVAYPHVAKSYHIGCHSLRLKNSEQLRSILQCTRHLVFLLSKHWIPQSCMACCEKIFTLDHTCPFAGKNGSHTAARNKPPWIMPSLGKQNKGTKTCIGMFSAWTSEEHRGKQNTQSRSQLHQIHLRHEERVFGHQESVEW